MWASCVRIVKIKCVWHHRCFHFLSLHTCGTFLLGWVRVSYSAAQRYWQWIHQLVAQLGHKAGGREGGRQGEAGGDRRGCPVLTRGGNSCHGRESWVMTFKAIVGLSVFIPKPADTRPKECVDSLMCLGHNLWPWSLSLLFFALWTPSLPRARLPPHLQTVHFWLAGL